MMILRQRKPTGTLRIAVWGAICALLLAPLLAMQFTNEVAWTASDFAAAAAMLAIVGVGFELILRSRLRMPLKAVLLAAILTVIALIWAQGAVGV